ncbi:MAG: hypothetical protein U1E65_15870 [Myxococcota bacterium]
MRTSVPLLALLFASACADAAVKLDPPDGGVTEDAGSSGPSTRLRAQVAVSLDGKLRGLVQLIDTQIGEACALQRFAPEGQPVACYPKASGLVYYADPACTQLVVETQHADHRWLTGDPLVVAGARLNPPPAHRYFQGRGCNEAGVPVDPVYEAQPLGDMRLAKGMLERDQSEPGLVVARVRGDDGSLFEEALIDPLTGAGCAPGETASAGGRCVPDLGILHDEGLLDPSCTQLAIVEYGSTPVAAISERGGEIFRFQIRTGTTVPLARMSAAGACTPEAVALGRKTLHLGTPYPERDWPSLTLKHSTSAGLELVEANLPSGRMVRPQDRLDDGAVFQGASGPCGPMWLSGSLRCAPGAEAIEVYRDNRCSEPLFYFPTDTPPPAEIRAVSGFAGPSGGGLPSGSVFTVGAKATPAALFAKTFGGSCDPYPIPGGQVFLRGEAQPPEHYPELRLELE